MFVKSDIRKITIALEKAYYADVYAALGRAGIVHLSRFGQSPSGVDAALQEEETLVRDMTAQTEYALNTMGIEMPQAGEFAMPADKSAEAAFAMRMKKIAGRALKLRAKIKAALDQVAGELSYAQTLERMGIDPQAVNNAGLVRIVFGTIQTTLEKIPDDNRFVLASANGFAAGVSLAADYPRVLAFLKPYGFTDRTGEVAASSREYLQKRLEALRRRGGIVEQYLERLAKEQGEKLARLNSACRAYGEMLKAVRMSVFSASSLFITGWMDVRDREKLLAVLRGICGNRFIFSERKDPQAPVRLINMKLLKPFELLVKTMGMPGNSEIDPTPLTAITFVLMFGLMFGDLGQGLVLALCGLLLKRYGQKKTREEFAQAGSILMACGLSAAVCGLLYGSVFSSEHLIGALWFHPAENIMRLFAATVLMGVVFIITGLFVNIVNSVLNADFTQALLEKKGLAVLVIYVFTVWAAVNIYTGGAIPAAWQTGAFIGLPLMIFSLRGVLGPLLFQSPKPHSLSEYMIETVMDIVEIVLSLFANTISFIRVGAFALSHAGLSIVTYTLAGMADPSMKSAGALVIIICGNIFIIGFEGLICGIQSMRLEYYEFFSKFFKGEGVAFAPFTLKAKVSEV